MMSSTHRVLITGFYDWRDLGEPPVLERCRENPSCRLLAGEGVGPRALKGPLSMILAARFMNQPEVRLEFKLLPVTWESATRLNLDAYDQVIHLGLGVYDSFHRILIESGAYNYRRGKDAAGRSLDEPLITQAPAVLSPPSAVRRGLQRALKVALPPPFKLTAIDARRDNSYLCNETHYRALTWIQEHPKARLKEAYFIHIPHREGDDDRALAHAISPIISSLIHLPTRPPHN